ncbi:GNAT family protein [Lysobacter sp. Root494]|uniref:GNAT family N-acetyltransferase n=1 Tax=Lysobacter sp. Root494 TaxID=1736549 RepID=UPI00070223EA|nr:GNAT family protein [Lysobacter sp. Root494]KQY51283.1 GCN5 family acetyltransferase [Lysobacter sp. Root494]
MTAPLAQGEILIRPLTANDALPLYRAVRASIDSLSYWLPWCHAGYSEADAADWTSYCQQAWESRREFPFGIFDRGGELLGGVGLSQVDRANNRANLGYWVAAVHRGKGIASTAARLAARMGFEQLGFTRIEIVVLVDNIASHQVAEKLGATREAEARNRLVFQGRPADAVVYSLIPGDLAASGG